MAMLLARSFSGLKCLSRSISVYPSLLMPDKMMPDPIEHATGLEKKELLARLAGNDNPFDMKVYKRGPGSKTNPNLVPSVSKQRIIGCICEEDATCINWMWLEMGEAKRCECGYWFKMVETKPL